MSIGEGEAPFEDGRGEGQGRWVRVRQVEICERPGATGRAAVGTAADADHVGAAAWGLHHGGALQRSCVIDAAVGGLGFGSGVEVEGCTAVVVWDAGNAEEDIGNRQEQGALGRPLRVNHVPELLEELEEPVVDAGAPLAGSWAGWAGTAHHLLQLEDWRARACTPVRHNQRGESQE